MKKLITIATIAKERSFESIYEEQNKLKIQSGVLYKDIVILRERRSVINGKIGRLGRIASAKRLAIVEKK